MPDTETLERSHTGTECLDCKAREQAIPPDAALRILISEDWDSEKLAFEPRAMNQDQAVAVALFANAVGHFWRAFGVETTGARLNALILVLRERARIMRIHNRILEARADINARARAAWELGDTTAMRAIEAEPTPDYPGKARDDAYLAEAR